LHDYGAALALLAEAREPVDRFFDEVMVMVDDPMLRANRLALLARLHALMNGVADISRLSVG
jgi:glycyl-tRNA synthetase beta chain